MYWELYATQCYATVAEKYYNRQLLNKGMSACSQITPEAFLGIKLKHQILFFFLLISVVLVFAHMCNQELKCSRSEAETPM